MAASATFALRAGVWFRRGRLLIVSPDSLGTACPLSGRNSTYRPVQILEAGSVGRGAGADIARDRDHVVLVCFLGAELSHAGDVVVDVRDRQDFHLQDAGSSACEA